jgi:hypothetical protein
VCVGQDADHRGFPLDYTPKGEKGPGESHIDYWGRFA